MATIHILLLSFLLAALLLVPVSKADSNEERFQQLLKMTQRGPLIHFTRTDMYHKFVTDAGRNYSFFVLYTATSAKYNCAPCVSTTQELQQFGISYEMFYSNNYQSASFLERPFFIAKIEPDDCMEVFQAYQFSTVPHFVYIPPGSKKISKLRDDWFLRNQKPDQHDIAEFVNKKISVDIPIYQSPYEKFAPIAAVAAAAFAVYRFARKHPTRFYSPMFWYILALATYIIVMAGVVYNRLRNPPFFDGSGGRIGLISPSPRTQYVAEGILVAFVMGGLGLVFVAMGDLVPRVKGAWPRRGVFWILSVLLFMLLSTLNNIFHVKYGWSAFRLNRNLF